MMTHRTRRSGIGYRAWGIATVLVVVCATLAGASANVPYTENFELLTLGELSGQAGWSTTAGGSPVSGVAEVQSGITFGGSTKAVALSNNSSFASVALSHISTNASITNMLWASFAARPVRGEAASFSTNSTAVFYVTTNGGYIVAYNWTNAVTLSGPGSPVVPTAAWSKFTVRLNYHARQWDLWMNGTNVFSDYTFYNTNQTVFTNFSVVEGSTSAVSYLDDVSLTETYTDAPFVHNQNGATNVGASAAFVNGALTLGSAPTPIVRVYWGATDGGTVKGNWNTWIDVGPLSAPTSFTAQASPVSPDTLYFYRAYASNDAGEAWSEVTHVWIAESRSNSQWHLASVPVAYSPSSAARMNSTAGQQLATGLGPSSADTEDVIWLQDDASGWSWLWLSNSTWVVQSDGSYASNAILPGMGFWVKRSANGPALSYSGLSGPKPLSATSIAFPTNTWRVFGWPYASRAQNSGNGWGFSSAGGAKTGTSVDNADNLLIEESGLWSQLYLGTNDLWYRRGFPATPVATTLKPGKGYYYLHRKPATVPAPATMTWAAPY